MIEISISSELAAAHPGFMAGCAERGHRMEVFGGNRDGSDSPGAKTDERHELRDAAYTGRRPPGNGAKPSARGALARTG